MVKILLNPDFVETNDVKQTGKYLLDLGDGTPAIELPVWLEKSKATDNHPNGKPWILLPKDNPTNRRYFSEDLFNETAVNGVVDVEVKTTAPRVLGATGVRQDVIKFLDDAEAIEYTELVDFGMNEYKAAKAQPKKKLEDMTIEELTAHIEQLKTGVKNVAIKGPSSFLEMFDEVQYNRYNELLAIAATNKANAPKAPRAKLTEEQKAARNEKRRVAEVSKAQALLNALQASLATPVEEDVE